MSGTSSSCRLCGHSTDDLVEIYSEQGLAADYARKICRYLYLLVTPDDALPKAICWMCSQQLDSFHRFHEKINEIQHRLLGGRFTSQYVIQDHHRLGRRSFTLLSTPRKKKKWELNRKRSFR
ncbi:hypothetical protein pipiens_009900 [Culex pipiens pipiens]|uniref:ZAD domain-containing protein n=1 Tax=Culex pipiens pipiens TaxID=38569 RepID=A0ABD1DC66_CULPP